MGEEADSVDDELGWTSRDDNLMALLKNGRHMMATGHTIQIRKMTLGHLRNSISYGLTEDLDYWKAATPLFEAELKRRESLSSPLLEK